MSSYLLDLSTSDILEEFLFNIYYSGGQTNVLFIFFADILL